MVVVDFRRSTTLTADSSSYPSWNPPSQLPLSGMPASATASYPPASIPAESYQKMPLSGTSSFTQEPQEMPMQTSMPSMQLSLAATEQQPPAIRTQYAYVQGTSAPPQLSVTTTSMSSSSDHGNLSVPRYVDSNPRPTKSPRHASHQSVPSTSSMSNSNDTSEYRYGPSGYVPVNSNSNELNSASTYSAESASGGAGAGAPSAGGPSSSAGGHSQQSQQPQSQQPPPRDYYPPTTSWTTTAGEPSSAPVHSYHSSGGPGSESSRPYYPGKSEHPPAQGSYASTLGHYSWSPT